MEKVKTFVHLYDHDNCDLYRNVDTLLSGIYTETVEAERRLREAAIWCVENPGEGYALDNGMSTLRFMTVQED